MKQNQKGFQPAFGFKKWLSALLALFVLLHSNITFAQTQEVKGTVTDSKGAPATGVTVGVKGGKAQTVTNDAGAFTIRVPQDATLTFSAVNFETAEVKVVPGQNVNFTLKEKVSQLN